MANGIAQIRRSVLTLALPVTVSSLLQRAEGIVAGELCGDVLITDSSYRISEQVAARVGQRIRPTGEFADRKIDVVRVLALVASRERISLHHQECSPRED